MTTVVAAVAVGGLLGGRRRRLWELAWLVLTTSAAWSRLRHGPASMREIADMLVTSVLIPPMATAHWAQALDQGSARRRSQHARTNLGR